MDKIDILISKIDEIITLLEDEHKERKKVIQRKKEIQSISSLEGGCKGETFLLCELKDLEFLAGKKIPEETQRKWIQLYQLEWLRKELRSASSWLEETGSHKKNYAKFFGGWLRRSSENKIYPKQPVTAYKEVKL